MIETLLNKLPEINLEKLKNEIHIYHSSQELDEDSIACLKKILSTDEIERAEKFYFEKDRKHYIASRGILRIILSKYLKINYCDIYFSYNEFGKPELDIEPVDNHLEFNLSHSGGKVIYALVVGKKIGVDIEKIRPIERSDQIINSFFSEKEKNDFNSLQENSKKNAFWNYWTRKEAYIKAHGKGLSMPLDQFSVLFLDGKIKLEHDIDGINEGENWSIEDIEIDNKYMSAVAYKGGFLPVVCKKLF